jgi:hypothetical protein
MRVLGRDAWTRPLNADRPVLPTTVLRAGNGLAGSLPGAVSCPAGEPRAVLAGRAGHRRRQRGAQPEGVHRVGGAAGQAGRGLARRRRAGRAQEQLRIARSARYRETPSGPDQRPGESRRPAHSGGQDAARAALAMSGGPAGRARRHDYHDRAGAPAWRPRGDPVAGLAGTGRADRLVPRLRPRELACAPVGTSSAPMVILGAL